VPLGQGTIGFPSNAGNAVRATCR